MMNKFHVLFSLYIFFSYGYAFKCAAQLTYSSSINLIPFEKQTREDSIKVVSERINNLMSSRQYYERSYLRKELVFVPWYGPIRVDKGYLRSSEIKSTEHKIAIKRKQRIVKKRVFFYNLAANIENPFIRRKIKKSPQLQMAETKLLRMEDYEFVLVEDVKFTSVNKDPRLNKLESVYEDFLNQVILGRPKNVEGFVNSINYRDTIEPLTTPKFIDDLIEQNLKIAVENISDLHLQQQVLRTSVTTAEFPGSHKLWINTDKNKKLIYLSPYLIRALFNISYYQVKIMKYMEGKAPNIEQLRIQIAGKSRSSMRDVDFLYYQTFIEIFSRNIQFILNHELAHIYLNDVETDRIEYLCDEYAAKFLINKFGHLDVGVFETLLIKSIETGDTKFWSNNLDVNSLKERHEILLNVAKKYKP